MECKNRVRTWSSPHQGPCRDNSGSQGPRGTSAIAHKTIFAHLAIPSATQTRASGTATEAGEQESTEDCKLQPSQKNTPRCARGPSTGPHPKRALQGPDKQPTTVQEEPQAQASPHPPHAPGNHSPTPRGVQGKERQGSPTPT